MAASSSFLLAAASAACGGLVQLLGCLCCLLVFCPLGFFSSRLTWLRLIC
jgi:hypothetical protein